jgi:hypothetical protein
VAGWVVLFEDALGRWEAVEARDPDVVVAVLEWLLDVVDHGPPDDCLPVPLGEDLYVGRVGRDGCLRDLSGVGV